MMRRRVGSASAPKSKSSCSLVCSVVTLNILVKYSAFFALGSRNHRGDLASRFQWGAHWRSPLPLTTCVGTRSFCNIPIVVASASGVATTGL
jgi:hypothetical protein